MQEELLSGAKALGLELNEGQIAAFERYADLLVEKNTAMNLTAIPAPAEIARLHLLDRLALLRVADFRGKRGLGVGCGAGLPGGPLLIGAPSVRLSLLDSTAKRMQWLSDELLPALGLEAECLTGRAEELIEGRREAFDLCVSRAVARLNILCELCLPYVRVGGSFLAMKGPAASDELAEAENAVRRLGGAVREIAEYPLGDAVHRVVVIDKTRPTPPRYPRRYAKIKQSPL